MRRAGMATRLCVVVVTNYSVDKLTGQFKGIDVHLDSRCKGHRVASDVNLAYIGFMKAGIEFVRAALAQTMVLPA
jgi:hypothetical protein